MDDETLVDHYRDLCSDLLYATDPADAEEISQELKILDLQIIDRGLSVMVEEEFDGEPF